MPFDFTAEAIEAVFTAVANVNAYKFQPLKMRKSHRLVPKPGTV
jgi:hypothetical protein